MFFLWGGNRLPNSSSASLLNMSLTLLFKLAVWQICSVCTKKQTLLQIVVKNGMVQYKNIALEDHIE